MVKLGLYYLSTVPVIQDRGHFEVVLKTAGIHIGRTYYTELSIDGEDLGVVETFLEEIYLYPGLQKFCNI